MHNEGLSLTFCLVLIAATAVVQAYEEDEPVGLDEKRGWNNFHSGYGKRGWNNFAGGYGKRSFDYVSVIVPLRNTIPKYIRSLFGVQ